MTTPPTIIERRADLERQAERSRGLVALHKKELWSAEEALRIFDALIEQIDFDNAAYADCAANAAAGDGGTVSAATSAAPGAESAPAGEFDAAQVTEAPSKEPIVGKWSMGYLQPHGDDRGAELADTVACLRYERQRAGELLRERDAEIARLSAPPAAAVMERGQAIASKWAMGYPHDPRFTDDAGADIARALQQYGDERSAAANDARKKAEGWCEVHGIYHRNFRCEHGAGIPLLEASAVAREAAIEEAARKAEDFGHSNGRILASHKRVAAAIRALVAKPASET